jgi:hypothetical protein
MSNFTVDLTETPFPHDTPSTFVCNAACFDGFIVLGIVVLACIVLGAMIYLVFGRERT